MGALAPGMAPASRCHLRPHPRSALRAMGPRFEAPVAVPPHFAVPPGRVPLGRRPRPRRQVRPRQAGVVPLP
eukprot:11224275-Lingulodinium_polyedra.AAC.1